MELPTNNIKQTKKRIAPELLSPVFMRSGEYHQYDDWKAKMQATYD